MVMRISRDTMLMGMAQIVAQRGTCSRLQVGAIVSRDGRVISTGYNGAPAGLPHCEHEDEEPPYFMGYISAQVMKPEQKVWKLPSGQIAVSEVRPVIGCETAEHAERNAIAFAARYGLALEGSELHCTHAPCLNCARVIINAGIKRVIYLVPYRLTAGVELLRQAGLDVVDINMIDTVE